MHRTKVLNCGLAAMAALFCGCTFIHYMGFPNVDFDEAVPSRTSDSIQLVRGRSGDGTEALRMSVRAASQDIQGEPARFWVQCLDGTLEVMLVTEKPLESRERCMRLEASVTSLMARTTVTRACVTSYSPKVLTVENPLAFLDFVGDATNLELRIGADEEKPATITMEPVLDREFLGEIMQLCPADWQPERREGQDAGAQGTSATPQSAIPDTSAGAPAGRVIDPSKPPTPFPGQGQTASAKGKGSASAARAKPSSAQGQKQDTSRDIEERLRRIEETAKAAAEL